MAAEQEICSVELREGDLFLSCERALVRCAYIEALAHAQRRGDVFFCGWVRQYRELCLSVGESLAFMPFYLRFCLSVHLCYKGHTGSGLEGQ